MTQAESLELSGVGLDMSFSSFEQFVPGLPDDPDKRRWSLAVKSYILGRFDQIDMDDVLDDHSTIYTGARLALHDPAYQGDECADRLAEVYEVVSEDEKKSAKLVSSPNQAKRYLSLRNLAQCVGSDPEKFFPDVGDSALEAKRICRSCLVSDDCLEVALENRERLGVWGGASGNDRKKINKIRKLNLVLKASEDA